MKIKIIAIGKTEEKYLKEGISIYLNKLKHYIDIEFIEIPDLKYKKGISKKEQKTKEGLLILNKLESSERLVLLDERGKNFTSVQFSEFIQQQMNTSIKRVTFVIGGPYGFSDELYQKEHILLSLSSMTFSHQMIRLFFLEQLYRGFTILNKEPYHHY